MRRIAAAAAIAGVLGMLPSGTAQAQAHEGAHHIYCVNNRLEIDRRPMSRMRMDRGNGADLCIMGPSFDFRSDAETWVRTNLRAGVGGPCGCR